MYNIKQSFLHKTQNIQKVKIKKEKKMVKNIENTSVDIRKAGKRTIGKAGKSDKFEWVASSV